MNPLDLIDNLNKVKGIKYGKEKEKVKIIRLNGTY